MNSAPNKLPVPAPDVLTQPFWDGCRDKMLLAQRCAACRKFRFYPTAACPFCAHERFAWEQLCGKGRLYTWTRVQRALDPAWASSAPYISAIVEQDEQPHLLIPGLMREKDLPNRRGPILVQVEFEDIGGFTLPRWHLQD